MDKLKKVGLKVTSPRLKILKILESTANDDNHMSAEDIYRRLLKQNEEISLATVYRVLLQFEQSGLIIRHRFDDHAIYELNTGEHHDHLVCVKCGKIDEFVDNIVEKRQQEIAQKWQYELTDHSLTIYGICSDCRDIV